MRIDLTVTGRDGRRHDVAVRAPGHARFADVQPVLARALALPSAPEPMWSGPVRVRPDARLGGRLLRTGAILDTSPIGGGHGPDDAPVLQVVGGPSAGRTLLAGPGTITIGRSPECGLRLDDPDVSRRHAAVTVSGSSVVIRDLGSTNGTTVGGYPVGSTGTVLAPGQLARLGDSFLSLHTEQAASDATRDGPDGAVLVNRGPRVRIPLADACIELPVRPDGANRARVQWLAALVPALVGGGLAWAMHSLQFLLFAALSPLMLLGTGVSDRLHWGRSRRRAWGEYRRADALARPRVAHGTAAEVQARHRAEPDPATVCRIAARPEHRLWERRRGDDDLLRVRIGLGPAGSALRVSRGATAEPAAQLAAVPVGADLAAGPLGIAAPRRTGLAVARWLVVQLATFAAPADVEIALLLSEAAAPSWRWARWLPHLGGRVASTPAQRQALLTDVAALVEERRARRAGERCRAGPWLVLVVDRCAELTDAPGLARLLEAADAGVTAICLDDKQRRLPAACQQVLRASGETGADTSLGGSDGTRRALVADCAGPDLAERVARALAPMVDPSGDPAATLPAEVRLADLLDLAEPAAADIARRWAADDGTATTALGVGADGVAELDLDRDGPHALVAGTTGAGKSELLQALVLGLAATHPPAAISFVLVDYKGGAAFADCARLPHTAGLVTDLDEHLTRRALISLDSELRRREELFAAAGAKDLASLRAAVPGRAPARLVIVVDEFAALADELPDFVSGLVGVAQRGRSLGVHLVLATQRPGGVVSPEIRANTALRIGLRMTSAAESADVIDGPEAAGIDRRVPGRAFVRAGSSTVPVQVARVGCAVRHTTADTITVVPLDEWGRPALAPVSPTARTDLQAMADAIVSAARAAGHARAPVPWLDPLPATLPSAALTEVAGDGRTAQPPAAVALGLLDLPARRAQPALTVDLGSTGSLLLAGAPRSGRTTALVSLGVGAATRLGPADLHIYAVDCGGRGLAPLAGLPHTGTYAAADDGFGPVATLLVRLECELAGRRAAMSALGVGSVAEARERGEPIPLVLLVLDGWEAFAACSDEHDAARTVQRLLALLRDAPACGLTVAVAGDRGALAPRVSGAVSLRLLLRLADRSDYAMGGVATRDVPELMPPGRAIRVGDGVEAQLAFAGCAPDRAGQERAVAACASRWRGAAAPTDLIRLRPLPVRVSLADIPPAGNRFRLGVGGDAAAPLAIDPFAGAGQLLVAGPARSGRSSALCTLFTEARGRRVSVVVAAPPRSPLRVLARAAGTPVIDPADPAPGLPEGERVLLLVDDCETVADSPAGDALCAWVRGSGPGRAAVVAGRSEELAVAFRGLGSEIRRSRCALLLQPGPVDGELVGVRLPRVRAPDPPGRGLLVADPAWGLPDDVLPIQVADPRPAGLSPCAGSGGRWPGRKSP